MEPVEPIEVLTGLGDIVGKTASVIIEATRFEHSEDDKFVVLTYANYLTPEAYEKLATKWAAFVEEIDAL